VTPAHDPNDFEAGKRHNLAKITVIDEEGKMSANAGAYAGLDRFEARKKIVLELDRLGFLDKIAPHTLSVGKCQRCKTVVEPLVSKQWFVKMKPLAEPAIKAVEDGRIQFIPDNWSKTYFEWMYNIRDWCISRQLWWGHRIPAWHCECGEFTVSRETPTACAKCGSSKIEQDPDVLDTWFSSGLWPFSTLGWPDNTEDLKKYYPTSVLITGFDIIFFWVARMIVMGIECTGEVPFRHVYIHGLVRDAERQKMSKTRGNTIDPLEVTAKYGTDAVRLSLMLAAPPGTDVVASEDRMESARNFANKIWNAARFLFLNMERAGVEAWAPDEKSWYKPEATEDGEVPLEDRWIFSRLNRCAEIVNRATENYRFHEVAQTLWQFFWNEFCDWYVEIKKLRFREGSGLDAHWRNILTVFESALRLLHPVMPFLTEELWQRLCKGREGRPVSIALAQFPQFNEAVNDAGAEQKIALVQEIVTSIRNMRADGKLDPKLHLDAVIYSAHPMQQEMIQRLANVKLEVAAAGAERAKGSLRSTPEFDLVLKVPAAQMDAQRTRLEKEIVELQKVIEGSERQLSNEAFLAKAPAKVLDTMRAKLADYQSQLAKSKATLEGLE